MAALAEAEAAVAATLRPSCSAPVEVDGSRDPRSIRRNSSGKQNGSGGRGRNGRRGSGAPGTSPGSPAFKNAPYGSRCRTKFASYMDRGELQQALKRGHAFRAKFRMNVTNRREAYCTVPGLPSDILLRGEINHNRAIEGDVVAVVVNKLADWFVLYKESARMASAGLLPEGDDDPLKLADRLTQLALSSGDTAGVDSAQQPWLAAKAPGEALRILEDIVSCRPDLRITGHVVSIIELSPKRDSLVGVLLPASTAAAAVGPGSGSSSGVAGGALVLVPLDPRMPRGTLSPDTAAQLSQQLREEAFCSEVASRTFVVGSIVEWRPGQAQPVVAIKEALGPAGELESGTAALLAAENVLDADFSLEAYACLPPTPWVMHPAQMAARRDLRSWRIFSIDPITARDLDDALSIEPLEGGRWRMGVHIADVASFVEAGSALDQEALLRGTSVYLTQRVIPMLPRLLCEQLCSLNPGDDRFAFSIVWEMDSQGHIESQWVGRSIINSCGKLAYPMVQQMIEGAFDPANWAVQLFNGATWDQVITDSLALHAIATQLRARRFASGALRLNNTRLSFQLDASSRPVGYGHYVQQEANQLVEEFMLLANMQVAALIADAFPRHALLRRHPPPNSRKLKELKAAADTLGLPLDISSAGALEASLNDIRNTCQDADIVEVLTMLTTKPMQLAQYFCSGEVEGKAHWRHYALAVDMYTHFTSPIRRYPDVMVHRLLQAALELRQKQVEAGLVPNPIPRPILQYQDQQQQQQGEAGEQQQEQLEDEEERGDSSQWSEVSESSEEEGAGVGAGRGDAGEEGPDLDPLAAEVLAEHQIPPPEEVEKVAKHSNDTKLSAKAVQEGSLKLCLCMLLKEAPSVVWGVATGLGGDQYVTVYIPEFGMETRMYLDQMGVPLKVDWTPDSGTLTIRHKEEEAEEEAAGPSGAGGFAAGPSSRQGFSRSGSGNSRGGGRKGRRSSSGGGNGSLGAVPSLGASSSGSGNGQVTDLNSADFSLTAWLDSLQSLRNPQSIPQAALPLQLKLFAHVPLVVGAYISKVTGAPVDIAAKLWVQGTPAKEVAAPLVAAAADAGALHPSLLSCEFLVDD